MMKSVLTNFSLDEMLTGHRLLSVSVYLPSYPTTDIEIFTHFRICS